MKRKDHKGFAKEAVSTTYAAETILVAVAQHYHVSEQDVRGPSRRRPVVRARQVAMFMLKYDGGLSSVEIGRFLRRHHATVLHGIRVVQHQQPTEPVVTIPWQVMAA